MDKQNELVRELTSNEKNSVSDINTKEMEKKKVPLGLSKKAIFMQVSMAFIVSMTVIAPGMGHAFPAITFDVLTDKSDPMALTRTEASWFASIAPISIPIGCFLCAYVVDVFGRKKALVLVNLFSITAWALMATSSTTNKNVMFIQLLVARFLTGISMGLSSSPGSIYSAEIAHSQIRGKLVIFTGLSMSLGMVLCFLWGYALPQDWRITSTFASCFSIFALILLIIVPESHVWLAYKRRYSMAESSLRQFRGLPKHGNHMPSELHGSIMRLRQSDGSHSNLCNVWKSFERPEVYKPLFIMFGFFAFQQLAGIFIVIVYAVQISRAAGVLFDPFISAIMIGISRTIATLFLGFTMDLFGRRIAAMFSGATMSMFMLGISGYLYSGSTNEPWFPAILLNMYMFASAMGLLTMPFAMNSEIFPRYVRGLATNLTLTFNFFLTFILVKIYPFMENLVGNPLIFMFFAVTSLISVVFVYFFLPETKGKSLDEIRDMFVKNPSLETAVKAESKDFVVN